jgi:hypothetical protein
MAVGTISREATLPPCCFVSDSDVPFSFSPKTRLLLQDKRKEKKRKEKKRKEKKRKEKENQKITDKKEKEKKEHIRQEKEKRKE